MGLKSTLEIFIVTFIGIFMLAALFSTISRDAGINLQQITEITSGYKLPGKPTQEQIQECQSSGGTIYCGNGWCYCTAGPATIPPTPSTAAPSPPPIPPSPPPGSCGCVNYHCSSVCANAGAFCIISWTCKSVKVSPTSTTISQSSKPTSTTISPSTTIPTPPLIPPPPSPGLPDGGSGSSISSSIPPPTTTITIPCECVNFHCSSGCGILTGQYCAYSSHCFTVSQ